MTSSQPQQLQMDFIKQHPGKSIVQHSEHGLLPKHKTSDQIFTLHTLIVHKYTQKKNKLYACFEYFQNALILYRTKAFFIKYWKVEKGETITLNTISSRSCTKAVSMQSNRITELTSSLSPLCECPVRVLSEWTGRKITVFHSAWSIFIWY